MGPLVCVFARFEERLRLESVEGSLHIQPRKQVFVLMGDDCTVEQDFMTWHGELREL